jgi:hypothetical protein
MRKQTLFKTKYYENKKVIFFTGSAGGVHGKQ